MILGSMAKTIDDIAAETVSANIWLGTPMLYCRATVAIDREFDRKNMVFAATGVVIASGVVGTYGGPPRNTAYMLASFIGEFPPP